MMLTKLSYNLQFFEAEGTPLEFGYQLGEFGKAAVHKHLIGSDAWQTVQQWQGSMAAATMASLVQEHCPDVWQELQGLAKGLALPFEQVFLWNARGDLWAMAPDGCTTVITPGSTTSQITHNEDGDPGFAGSCAMVQRNVNGQAQFASFIYPGSLPGHTLAVNRHGLAMTVNNIRALTTAAGLPRMVLTRSLLEAKNVPAALDLLRGLPKAGAFHLSLADPQHHLFSVEFSHFYCSASPVQTPALHANHAIHQTTRDWPQIITGSSGRRQVRGDYLLRETARQPLDILSDTDESGYPIYRRLENDSDNENTLATSDMIIGADGVSWQVYADIHGPATYRFHNANRLSS